MSNDTPLVIDGSRRYFKNKKLNRDAVNNTFISCNFEDVTARGILFRNVDFSYTKFDHCYFRNCTFDSCNFTGAKIINSNFHGSKFNGSNFSYTIFDKTIVDPFLLNTECPGEENLKMRFARTLRLNFQSIGDVDSVNRAILVELNASEQHLLKTWKSKESYYRDKYKGVDRIEGFFKWFIFKLLDFVWGNGESSLKLIRFVGIILICISIFDGIYISKITLFSESLDVLGKSPSLFMGFDNSINDHHRVFSVFLYVCRFILMTFFISIIIKRFNRR